MKRLSKLFYHSGKWQFTLWLFFTIPKRDCSVLLLTLVCLFLSGIILVTSALLEGFQTNDAMALP